MGWASGSRLFSEIIEATVAVGVDKVTRKELYEQFMEKFEEFDCDTLDECKGIDDAFDEVWDAKHPEYIDDGWPHEQEEE
jgi:hypothetical protein